MANGLLYPVLGIGVVNVLVWVPIIMWMRRRSRAAAAELTVAIEAETVIRPPESGTYRGATAQGYPTVKNTGVIALSRQRLVFLTLTGKLIEIPLTAITGLRESKAFKGSLVGGRTHLLVGTASGEIGFFASDTAAWINAITSVCPQVGSY